MKTSFEYSCFVEMHFSVQKCIISVGESQLPHLHCLKLKVWVQTAEWRKVSESDVASPAVSRPAEPPTPRQLLYGAAALAEWGQWVERLPAARGRL